MAIKVAVAGLTVTDTVGVRVTVPLEDFAMSATLVAVTVTICCELIVAGAVYRPVLDMVPTPAGLIDQVTAVLLDPETVAVNCCV